MSVKLAENSYVKLREHESSYQAMIRNGDTSNTYDITQRFVKNSDQNDFIDSYNNWNWNDNRGLLSDGLYINKRNFFTTSVSSIRNDKRILTVNNVKYFMFKMNCVLEKKRVEEVKDTYISKENDENIYELAWKLDENNNTIYYYNTSGNDVDSEGKISIKNEYSSYPLQRLDKLSNYELGSLFLYINGVKIPDNEIFVYATKTFTDIFIPLSYIGDLNNSNFETDVTFFADIRQAGSEDFYFISDNFSGNTITIDLSKKEYLYDRWNINKVTADKTVVFIDGLLNRVKSIEYLDEKQIKFTFEKSLSGRIELYILNDMIYRHKIDDNNSMVNKNSTELHFFLNEKEFEQDFVNGPITKNAISFYYDGKRIDDTLIKQTSRYSFVYDISDISSFDESKIDFFVEDINYRISDKDYIMYGDDYYLLNMLGVSRCVDRMKGGKTYSVFDLDENNISFRDVLSNNCTLFDVPTAQAYYASLEKTYNNDSDKCKELIKKNPALLRDFLQQFATPSKKFIVNGNASDVRISSVQKLNTEDDLIYYKIYCNHKLVDAVNYTAEREGLVDFITIDKSVLKSGTNLFEVFQYDLTYYNQTIFRDNINNMTPVLDSSGINIVGYSKTYKKSELPFGENILLDDIVAIEPIERNWFTKADDEYYLVYPSTEEKGFRVVKSLTTEYVGEDSIKITINLYMPTQTKGYFYLVYKNFNIVKSITYHNEDSSYMDDNDLIFPVYSQYVEYEYNSDGSRKVKEVVDYIPYINNSEPMVTRNGKEMIIGDDYLWTTPEKSDGVVTSFLILKTQTAENDEIVIQFNSAKTNILILGYNNLNIDNKYGLVYFSELKYPFDPNYMNLFVNGEKVSKYDITILSDKLIRIYNIYRPITSLLITTNLQYKESELSDYLSLYQETEFEKLLAKMFNNCDPSKNKSSDRLDIDYIYTVKENSKAYKINHGFDLYVDDVQKAENPLASEIENEDEQNITQVMYIKWLNKSGKTRSDNFPELDINPKALKYFSIFENYIVSDRFDIFIDSGTTYNGVPEDITGEPIKTGTDMKRTLIYPGADINLKRKFFYDQIFVPTINSQTEGQELQSSIRDQTTEDPIFNALKRNDKANILYAEDFPLNPDKNGIRWTGSNVSYVCNENPTFK